MRRTISYIHILLLAATALYLILIIWEIMPLNDDHNIRKGIYDDKYDLKVTHELIEGKKLTPIAWFAYAPLIAIDKNWKGEAALEFWAWTMLLLWMIANYLSFKLRPSRSRLLLRFLLLILHAFLLSYWLLRPGTMIVANHLPW